MYHIVESSKTFDAASDAVAVAVKHNGFGVLHVHDLGATLRSKGISFAEECRVFEVCNPTQAANVLTIDMRLNMALPCRISVYTEKGNVRIGYIRPVEMLGALSQDSTLLQISHEVEKAMNRIVEEAR